MHEKPIAWLSIIGITESGIAGLGEEARAIIAAAKLVVGGRRHLDLARGLIAGEMREWPSPLDAVIPDLLALRPAPVCVLASGDPFLYGAGATLARHIPPAEMRVFPAPSAFSLAAARMGWASQDSVAIGLNNRPLERLIPHLQPGARIIALTTDETAPPKIAALIAARGFGDAQVTLLERLGGPHEQIRAAAARDFAFADIARLNCLAIDIPAHAEAVRRAVPRAPGLPDDLFEHDGQLTKREIRAVTLSSLAPRRGELLWDIGLGAGSVAIEWMLADPMNRAIGIEQNPDRADRAARNAASLGAPGLRIVLGAAPAALADLPAPDAVFIGGGASIPGVINAAWAALKPGGRLVANAIALETESVLLTAQRRYGGSLLRLGVERAEPVGRLTGWRPAMTVTQWTAWK